VADVVIPGIKLVWDLMTGLISEYEAEKKGLFAAHVEPLRDKMHAIHKDYIAGFEEVKRHLENNNAPPSEVIEFLEERRRDFLTERELATELARALHNAERRVVRGAVWDSVRAYCQAILTYFSATSDVAEISWYSDFLAMLRSRARLGVAEGWHVGGISGNPRDELLRAVKELLDVRLPAAFSPINKQYAILRTQLL
jgi:hypothetical protein